MPRCVPLPPPARCHLRPDGRAADLVRLTRLGAQERVQRSFPADALRGALLVTDPPDVQLNAKTARLAPGARIRGANNLLVLSASLAGQKLLVHYTRDGEGLLKDVWILRADEAARFWPASAEEAARYRFDPAAQTWTR
jgi:hypothetical protein